MLVGKVLLAGDELGKAGADALAHRVVVEHLLHDGAAALLLGLGRVVVRGPRDDRADLEILGCLERLLDLLECTSRVQKAVCF